MLKQVYESSCQDLEIYLAQEAYKICIGYVNKDAISNTKTNGMKRYFLYFLLILVGFNCTLKKGQSNDAGLTGTWQLYDAEPSQG